jgi:hypothetical protein
MVVLFVILLVTVSTAPALEARQACIFGQYACSTDLTRIVCPLHVHFIYAGSCLWIAQDKFSWIFNADRLNLGTMAATARTGLRFCPLAFARIIHTGGWLGLLNTALITGKLQSSSLALKGLVLILCEDSVIAICSWEWEFEGIRKAGLVEEFSNLYPRKFRR